ncbi:hypothetical protein AaE_009007 [Aphanomyces astaci]|uniref:Secreted protein n=1 Tax=Aphanomyces astaci TaxID=112090 RepID=A0A6A5A934_APHAT|nr:hypothetical protein AaE_009007 [Aphanomyces astaci]
MRTVRSLVVLSTIALSTADEATTCEKHDLMAVLGVAMLPAWPNCSQAMGASDATAPALDLAVDSAMSLTTFCNTPACVQNLQALYMNLPNCVGPNGLNIQKLNLYTTDILCDTLPPALLTQSPSERCTEVDLAVLEFLWMFPPWKNCTSKLLGPPLAQLMTGNASQTAAFCAAPACVEYANSIFQRMPSCTNNSTLQVGWANLGANSKSDLLAKLSATCTATIKSTAMGTTGSAASLRALALVAMGVALVHF